MAGRLAAAALVTIFAGIPAVLAQQSASFSLTESVFNAGGSPADGLSGSSASFRVSHDALGDAAPAGGLSSTSFLLDGGFVSAYAPPGEVHNLVFTSPTSLAWSGPVSAVTYNAYRDQLSSLAGLGYGTCRQQGLASNTWSDGDTPTPGDGFFYLVTGVGRLEEEGTKGFTSDGSERLGASCP